MYSSLYKKLADGAAFALIQFILILTAVSLLAIWEYLGKDILQKSFYSVAFISIFAIVIIVAEKFLAHDAPVAPTAQIPPTDPAAITVQTGIQESSVFTAIRRMSVIILIISATVLAFVGLLAIWDIFPKELTYKSTSSLAVLAFSSFLNVMICLQREKKNIPIVGSLGGGIFLFFCLWLFLSLFRFF